MDLFLIFLSIYFLVVLDIELRASNLLALVIFQIGSPVYAQACLDIVLLFMLPA
jgi:hypothetical protein